MRFVTDFADQAVVLPLAGAVGVALLLAGWRRGALAWLGAVAATLGAVLVLKVSVIACGLLPIADLHSPSGHTASAAVVYGGLGALLLPDSSRDPAGRTRPLTGALLAAGFAALFGLTRLRLHLHTPADVLVGACVGVSGALLLTRLAGPRPKGLRVAVPLLAMIAVGLVFHGMHLHAEERIGQVSCPWPLGGMWAAAPHDPSARP